MASYGTVQGVQDELIGYQDLIDNSLLDTDIIERFLVRACNKIDARLSSIPSVVTPLATVPGVINDIAVDLAVCNILRRLLLGEDPNRTAREEQYCDKPLEELDELIKQNPGLFSGTIDSAHQIKSNRVGEDREFSISEKVAGIIVGDSGTTDNW